MKVAIIGSRKLNVDIGKYIPKNTTMIITGGAMGIDTLAERYADCNHIPKLIIKPDYGTHGRSAPIIRNKTMVDYADLIIAVWDGFSKGTQFTIHYAIKKEKEVRTYIMYK